MGGNNERFQGHKTAPGYGAPDEPAAVDRGGRGLSDKVRSAFAATPARQPEAPLPAAPRHPALYTAPPPEPMRMIEVEVLHETGAAPSQEVFDRSVEIWTQNHVYILDPQMVCTAVRSIASGKESSGHELLGTRLVGGQLDGQPSIQLSYPFPAPGSTAVFQAVRDGRKQYSRTSGVRRVVLRLHVLTVNATDVIPAWKEITSPHHDDR